MLSGLTINVWISCLGHQKTDSESSHNRCEHVLPLSPVESDSPDRLLNHLQQLGVAQPSVSHQKLAHQAGVLSPSTAKW